MGDVLGERVLAADGGDAALGGFAGFGESIVARIKVFTLLTHRKRYGSKSYVWDTD